MSAGSQDAGFWKLFMEKIIQNLNYFSGKYIHLSFGFFKNIFRQGLM